MIKKPAPNFVFGSQMGSWLQIHDHNSTGGKEKKMDRYKRLQELTVVACNKQSFERKGDPQTGYCIR